MLDESFNLGSLEFVAPDLKIRNSIILNIFFKTKSSQIFYITYQE